MSVYYYLLMTLIHSFIRASYRAANRNKSGSWPVHKPRLHRQYRRLQYNLVACVALRLADSVHLARNTMHNKAVVDRHGQSHRHSV